MTVREITKTTLSVIVLIIGFVFFRFYYTELLSVMMRYFVKNDGFSFVINERLSPNNYIGNYFPALFYFNVIIIIIVCMMDAIFNKKTAFYLLSSFALPLIMTALATVFLCIEKINIFLLWALLYACVIICLHSAFKKILLNSKSIVTYTNLKLIKEYFLAIKNAFLRVISAGIRNFDNPIDEITVFSASSLVLLCNSVTLISLIIYLAKYWRLVFLLFLVNSF